MNIARAAKGAASLLMVFGLVALVACQAGPAGTPGTKGDKGDTGAPGAPGAPGPAALGAVASDDTHFIFINNAGTIADPLIGNLNEPKPDGSADVTALFAGGTSPIKYAISTPPTTGPFRASLNDDNEIVITKRVASDTDPDGHYNIGDGSELTVRATDANGVTATKNVEILTNKAPLNAGPATPNPFVVGTQSEKYSDTYKAQNVVSLDFDQRPSGSTITGSANWYFADADTPGDTSAEALAARKLLTYKLLKTSRGTGNGEEYATVELTGSVLKVTGLKSTWDKDATPAAHVPVSIEIEVSDPGGLSIKRTFRVVVDGAPEIGDTAPRASIVEKATGVSKVVVRSLPSFFRDPEGATATVTIVGATIAPSQLGAVTVDSGTGNLSLTPNNAGSATITFYAQTAGVPLAAQGSGYLPGTALDRDGDGTAEAAAARTITQVLKHEIKVTITP